MIHTGHEYTKSWPRIIICRILRTRAKWLRQWNYLILVWDTGKPSRFQTWPEDRGYTVCWCNDAIECDSVTWQFRVSFVSYPYVYIALKCSFFATSITHVEINKYKQQPATYVFLTYTVLCVVSNSDQSTIFITGGKYKMEDGSGFETKRRMRYQYLTVRRKLEIINLPAST